MFLHYYRPSFRKKDLFATPISALPPSSTNSTNSSRHTVDISDDEINDLMTDNAAHGGGDFCNSTPVTDHTHSLLSAGGVEDFSCSVTSGKCVGVTRAGLPCKIIASPKSKYCFRHRQ